MSETANPICTRTLRHQAKPKSYAWLKAAAIEVNQVRSWANATSMEAADRNRRAHRRPARRLHRKLARQRKAVLQPGISVYARQEHLPRVAA